MYKYKKILLISVVVLLFATLLVIIKKRSSIYPYEVDKDYEYNFHQTNANITDLNLKDGKISFDKLDNTNQSAFLRININTTFMGKYFQPSVEINTGKSSFTQYFEHGAKGIRYINISPLQAQEKIEIKFEGKNVSIDDQTVQLVRFDNHDIGKLKILVLAPHPDDAEIAAYGLYSENKESYIITVTAGDAGEYKYDEIYQNKVQHYMKKGELRTWNSITVPLLGGIPPEQTINLGFFDATLERMFSDKSKPVSGLYTNAININTYRKLNVSSLSAGLSGESSWNSLVKNLSYLLEEIEPNIIVAPYPALDSHSDHKFSSIALFEAIKASNILDGHLYLYSNHLALNEYFPYGKEGGAISLPPNFGGGEIYFDSIYSHPLSFNKQKDKVFALEAMNDLRLDTEWRFVKSNVKMLLRMIKQNIMGEENSYYKRSIRHNELFIVVKISSIYEKNILNRLIGER